MNQPINNQVCQILGSEIKSPPTRMISLVPSLTELVLDLGLVDHLVGRTKFCIHPDSIKSITHVGGTKNFNFERIAELQPDLIICNKEENYEAGVLELAKNYPVLLTDIYSLDDALFVIEFIGQLCNKTEIASVLAGEIKSRFDQLACSSSDKLVKVAYLIWKDPMMVAASGTFIDQMLQLAGFNNVYEECRRYPVTSYEELKQLNPDYVLLSSEPWPFKESNIAEFQPLRAQIVDGEMFSWYGSRLLRAPEYFYILKQNLDIISS